MYEFISHFASNLVIYQILIGLIKVIAGAGLCFGALKWRRGLLTTTASYWGIFLGIILGLLLDSDIEVIILFILVGLILFPILTYSVPGINRFVLGFLVSCKLSFMLSTVLMKSGDMDIETALIFPLIIGTIIGIFLMCWKQMRVSAFVLGCTFIGASEIAPVISEWVNRLLFSITGDYSFLFDPIDFLFSLFKIELTDTFTLIFMIIFMIWGVCKQVNNLKLNNIPLDTPIIGFEVPRSENGKLYMEDRVIDTMK